MQPVPMFLCMFALSLLALAFFRDSACKSVGEYEDECRWVAQYGMSAACALVLIAVMFVMMTPQRPGMGMGMGMGYGGYGGYSGFY